MCISIEDFHKYSKPYGLLWNLDSDAIFSEHLDSDATFSEHLKGEDVSFCMWLKVVVTFHCPHPGEMLDIFCVSSLKNFLNILSVI